MRLPEAGSGYDEEEYRAFWNGLDPEDRIEFSVVHQGSEAHARFVYLLDKWMISGGKWSRPDFGQIVEAYALAFSCTAATARKHYSEALEHPAVQSILARLTNRETFSAYLRIMHKRHSLTEKVLDEALDQTKTQLGAAGNLKLVGAAIRAAASLSDSVSAAQAEGHATRTKVALERARAAAAQSGATRASLPSEDELVVFFRWISGQIGAERFDALVCASRQPVLGQ